MMIYHSKRNNLIQRLIKKGVLSHEGTPIHEMDNKQLLKLSVKVGKENGGK